MVLGKAGFFTDQQILLESPWSNFSKTCLLGRTTGKFLYAEWPQAFHRRW